MAEAIGLASGLLALTTFALKSSTKLRKTIQSFSTHPRQVRELLTELSGLVAVLENLSQLSNIELNVDLSAIALALKQCHEACQDFEVELMKYSSRCTGNGTDFRDWARFKFRGSDSIDGFRQQLVGYKATINVALGFANLHTSTVTVEAIQSCRILLETTTIDLQDRLTDITQKLEELMLQRTNDATPDTADIQRIEEERLSTEKALFLCNELSRHIDDMQLSCPKDDDRSPLSDLGLGSNRFFSEGLDGCRDYMTCALRRLEKHRQEIANRLKANPTATVSSGDKFLAEKLRGEANALRHGLEFLSNVDTYLDEQMSNIENHAEGDDTIQIMASTDGKPIKGKNNGVGDRLKQAGGHYDNDSDSLRQISQDFAAISLQHTNLGKHKTAQPSTPDSPKATDAFVCKPFSGPGFTLASKSDRAFAE